MITRRSLFGLALLPVVPALPKPASRPLPLGEWLESHNRFNFQRFDRIALHTEVDFKMTEVELREIEYQSALPPR